MVPVSNSWKVCLQDCISGVAVLCPGSLPEPDRLDGIVNSPAAFAAQVWSLTLLPYPRLFLTSLERVGEDKSSETLSFKFFFLSF